MTYGIEQSSKFKKSYKLAQARGWDVSALDHVIVMLASGIRLPAECRDHKLKGEFSRYRECHINGANSDWVLIYRKDENRLILHLLATGTHRELHLGS